jgi:hypothetical protein
MSPRAAPSTNRRGGTSSARRSPEQPKRRGISTALAPSSQAPTGQTGSKPDEGAPPGLTEGRRWAASHHSRLVYCMYCIHDRRRCDSGVGGNRSSVDIHLAEPVSRTSSLAVRRNRLSCSFAAVVVISPPPAGGISIARGASPRYAVPPTNALCRSAGGIVLAGTPALLQSALACGPCPWDLPFDDAQDRRPMLHGFGALRRTTSPSAALKTVLRQRRRRAEDVPPLRMVCRVVGTWPARSRTQAVLDAGGTPALPGGTEGGSETRPYAWLIPSPERRRRVCRLGVCGR